MALFSPRLPPWSLGSLTQIVQSYYFLVGILVSLNLEEILNEPESNEECQRGNALMRNLFKFAVSRHMIPMESSHPKTDDLFIYK